MERNECFTKQVNKNAVMLIKLVVAGVILLFPLIILCVWAFTMPHLSPSATPEQVWQRFDTQFFWLMITAGINLVWGLVVGVPFVVCYMFKGVV